MKHGGKAYVSAEEEGKAEKEEEAKDNVYNKETYSKRRRRSGWRFKKKKIEVAKAEIKAWNEN